MNSWYHAQSCSKKWGGTPEDYLPIHHATVTVRREGITVESFEHD